MYESPSIEGGIFLKMIKIIIKKDLLNRIIGFSIQGHAEFAEEGTDIVCAGISALAQSAAAGAKEILGLDVRLIVNDGFFYFELPEQMPEEKAAKAYFLTETVYRSFMGVKENYTGYISIEEVLVEYKKNKKYKIVPLPRGASQPLQEDQEK